MKIYTFITVLCIKTLIFSHILLDNKIDNTVTPQFSLLSRKGICLILQNTQNLNKIAVF